ncbi:MAG: glycosyltransferase family 4 protein [Actinomycetota bacterium]|nr:glycosyltransferase family 4 protein [Actinomycetota bacterium]
MKVVHIVKDNLGGVFVYEEVCRLTEAGLDVTTILPATARGNMAARYRDRGLPLIDADPNLYPANPRRTLANARRLRRELAALQPDLVHVHHLAPCLLLRLATGRRPAFPRIFEVHGPLHLESPHTRRADLSTRGPRDYYIATSRATHRLYLDAGVGEDRIMQTYSGCETTRYMTPRTGKLRSELGVGEDVPLAGMVAWMYRPKRYLGQRVGLKGHDLFIRAIPKVVQEFPEARFVIVGAELDGRRKYEMQLQAMAASLGVADVLTFFGPRADAAALQPDLDVAVHPSRSENPGGAIYTLLAGVPTAASRVGGLPEIVRHEQTGLLFDRDDVDGLAGSIRALLRDRDRAREMAMRGRALAQEMFDLSKTVPDILRFYDEVLAREGSAAQGSSRSI